jgi:hypothetical protein
MHHTVRGRIRPGLRLHHTRYGVARVLVVCGVTLGAAGHASAQTNGVNCEFYDTRCRGVTSPPMCAQLRTQCAASAHGTTSTQSIPGRRAGMPQLDAPTTLPDCAEGLEMVMVPTCQCETPLDAGTTAAGNSACASCTSDGYRIECQSTR